MDDNVIIDRAAMGRLAKALAFICGPQHPTTVRPPDGGGQRLGA
ncbi:hypothetical protein [Hyphomicrobium sp.]|nr:hypothetical protein [Hyphomicrobium sp.]